MTGRLTTIPTLCKDLPFDLIKGRLDATPAPILSVLPRIKAGKLRALGLMNDRRSDLLPGVRTVAEAGIKLEE